MHQNSEAKQPKETDEIKKKLESYAALHRRIDNQIERLENLEAVMAPYPRRASTEYPEAVATEPANRNGK